MLFDQIVAESLSQNILYVGWGAFCSGALIVLLLALTPDGHDHSPTTKLSITVCSAVFICCFVCFEDLLPHHYLIRWSLLTLVFLMVAELLFFVYRGETFAQFMDEKRHR